MLCKNCGKEISGAEHFCDKCGAEIKVKSSIEIRSGAISKKKMIVIFSSVIIVILAIIVYRLNNKEYIAKKLLDSYIKAADECDYDAYADACVPDWKEDIFEYRYEKYDGYSYTYDSYVVDETDDLHSDFEREYGKKVKWTTEIERIEEVSDDDFSEIAARYNNRSDKKEPKVKVQSAYEIECCYEIEWKEDGEWQADDLHFSNLMMIKANNEWSLYVVPNLTG